MKLKLLFSWLLLQGLILNATAQITPIYNVQSPEVAALGEYGAVPVGLYTGVPNISVPLYEVKVGNYSLPISANYHLASVKPTVPSGPLGLGWSLSAGGYISRSVRNTPDEKKVKNYEPGYTYFTTPGFYANAGRMKGMTIDQFKAFWGGEYNANELIADEFSFNFCGYSGNFYYNEDCGWSVVSDQDIKVEFDENQGGFLSLEELKKRINTWDWTNESNNQRFFNKFTLITPDGTRYEFGGINATEYSISYYQRNYSDLVATTWKLAKITTVDKRMIEFIYDTTSIICDLKYVPQSLAAGYEAEGGYLDPNNLVYPTTVTESNSAMTGFLIFPANIEQIITSNECIQFSYSKDPNYYESFVPQQQCLGWFRENLYDRVNIYHRQGGGNDPANQFGAFLKIDPGLTNDLQFCRYLYDNNLKNQILKTMTVTNLGGSEDYKTVRFDYTTSKNERRKLITIKESGRSLRQSRGLGDIGDLIDPDGPVYDAFNPRDRFHRFTYNTSKKMPVSTIRPMVDAWGYYTGSDYANFLNPSFYVSVASLGAKADILTQVQYPTGGRSKFEYELNDYSRVVSPSRTSLNSQRGDAGGLRISQITNTDAANNIVQIKKYYYSENRGETSPSTSSGILKELPFNEIRYKLDDRTTAEFKSKGGFFGPSTNQNSPTVGYSCVIEELLDGGSVSMGYTRYRYSNYDQDMYGQTHFDEKALYCAIAANQEHYIKPYTSRSMERGKLLSEEHYDKNNALKKKTTYKYAKTGSSYFRTAHQNDIYLGAGWAAMIGSLTKTYLYSYLLEQVTETLYTGTFGLPVEQTKTFTYNDYKLLQQETSNTSRNGTHTVAYKYLPQQSNYSSLGLNHVLSPIIEKKTTEGADIRVERYSYGATSGIPYISEATIITNNHPRTEYTVTRVDAWGNPMEVDEKGLRTVYLWGYQGQKLIAKIVSVSFAELNLPNDPYCLGNSESGYSQIEYEKSCKLGSQFYIYTYNGRQQLESITNPNGVATNFSFDFMGRLIERYYMDNTNGSSEERLLNRYGYFYQNPNQ